MIAILTPVCDVAVIALLFKGAVLSERGDGFFHTCYGIQAAVAMCL
jgi:hypothetical protein